ncbi:MAG: glycosyltransferase family 2 protein [Beduini sp.]|uniref:glycosyltransferase family 2 protein n=1 Tax=Beduini sp. TaxID=1922300 RepID=UPI0039908EA4
MNYKCYIDEFKLKILEDKKYFILCGWTFSSDGSDYELGIKINNTKVEFELISVNRQDVVIRFPKKKINPKCGFRIIIPCNQFENISELELFAVSKTNKVLLKKLTKNDILKNIDESYVDEVVESYVKDHGKAEHHVVSGWAVSLNQNKLNFKITNSAGHQIDHTIRFTNRSDLVLNKVVKPEDKYAGFTVEFDGSNKDSYQLHILNGQEEVIEDIEKVYITKKQRMKMKIKHYFNVVKLKNFVKVGKYLIKYGPKALIKRLRNGPTTGMPYQQWFEIHKVTDKELRIQKETIFEYSPKISVIVPTYNTPEKFLVEMIDSLITQSYSNWELCIADGSDESHLARKIIKEYTKKDDRIKACYLDENYGISGNTNKALELATGDYVGLFDHDDLLTPDCLFEIVKNLQNTKYDILYTDEDKLNNATGEFEDPNFKPDFSPDLFYSHNYITHFFVVKREIINKVGGFRSEFDGAQDYDLMFRCIEQSKNIYHIAKILYHWRMHAASTAENPESKLYCYEAGRQAIQEHYQRIGIQANVECMKLWGMYHSTYETTGNPLVSIIIPNKDHEKILKTCIDSLYNNNSYTNFEIIIVENNSTTKEIFEYYEILKSKHSNIKIVTYTGDFNYSAINNFGVKSAQGEFLLFLNNDTEMIKKDALSEMLGCCIRNDVGIVGAKLLYDDNTVQHAGVVIGFGGFAGHVFTGIGKDDYGYMVRAQLNCNYSAVTAACMLVKKSVYDSVDGFSEEFKVGLNDIDFCLKVRETGKLIVYNAHSLWHHYESKSRGYEDTVEKQKRFESEIHLFQDKWKDILLNGDPYYNKNFVIELGPFKLG